MIAPGLRVDPRRAAELAHRHHQHILIEAAVEAGVEFREGCSVRELTADGNSVTGVRAASKSGSEFTESARIVIGADGMHSVVAKHVKPGEYETVDSLSYGYYTYWQDVTVPGAELYFFDDVKGILAFPTNDNKTCIGVGGAIEGFHEFRGDIEGNYMKIVDRVPSIAEQVHASPGHERFLGTADQRNFFRKPYGPGWALVGDAGYHLHPITAQGITDAFLDAERLTDALDATFTERSSYNDAMAAYQRARDEAAMPMYEMTFDFAQVDQPPPPETQQLLSAVAGNQQAMDDFASVQAGTLPIPEFFSPENIGRILAAQDRSA
jgi:2-polyprenyl-6-methoxyphenol hydroxylase-like FAD-dependent oxidoreductase